MNRIGACGLDLLAVVVFVVIGRANHDEGETVASLARTLWPFAVGLGVGWGLAWLARRDFGRIGTGVVVWLACVGIGIVLRAVAGQGVAAAFVVVALVVLGLFLLGWRAVDRLSRRLRAHAARR